MRRACALGDAPLLPDCPAGEIRTAGGACVADPCSAGADVKRYVGWGILGLLGGSLVGQVFFKAPAIAALAGTAAGVAYAAKSNLGCEKTA